MITRKFAYAIPRQSDSPMTIPLKGSFPRLESLKIATPIDRNTLPANISSTRYQFVFFMYVVIIPFSFAARFSGCFSPLFSHA